MEFMTILIPKLYCVYKTRFRHICVCSFVYKSGSFEMKILGNEWLRKNDTFYLTKKGVLESNFRNDWITESEKSIFELVEKLTYLRGETYN